MSFYYKDSFSRGLACLLLSACVINVSTQREKLTPIEIDDETISANVCAGEIISFRFGGKAPGTGFDGDHIIVPKVMLTNGVVQIDMSASWRADLSLVEAKIESLTIPPAVYAVEIDSASNGTNVLFAERVVVRARPVIAEVVGSTVCGSAQTVTLKGTGFLGTVTKLAGLATPLSATINATGTEIIAALPDGLTSTTPYQIVVTAGASCEATAATMLTVAAPPETSTLVTGPSLLSMTSSLMPQATGVVPQGVRAELRINGTGFTPGSRVFVGGQEATGVSATPDGVELTASIDGLPAGSHEVRVANGNCESTLSTPLVVAAPTLALTRMTPNAVSSAGEKFLVDAFGDFSAATQGLLFFIDTDPDPFAETLVALRYDVRLDGTKTAARLQVTGALPVGGPFDVHVLSFGAGGSAVAGVLPQALRTMNAADIPRIVHKSDDWITASGGMFRAYGCGFDGTSFSLVPDGSGAPLPLAGTTITAASSWATQRLRCRVATSVTHEASWSALSVPPGVYHLRATRVVAGATITHDDLYPLVVYRDAPETQNATLLRDSSNNDVRLLVARKLSHGLTAIDPTGRKYAYFMGGSDSSGMAISASAPFADNMNTLEFTALDRDHKFVGLEPAPQPLGVWGLFFERNALGAREDLPHYAMSMVADGPIVYSAGGMVNDTGNAVIDDGVYQTRVAHEEDGAPSLVSAPVIEPLGFVPAGTHHYRIAAYYPAEDTHMGFVESITSAPVTVTLSSPSRVRFSVTAKCGPTRAGYGGTPVLRVFRADTSQKIPDESVTYGFVNTTTASASAAACVPGSIYTAADEGADFSASDTDRPIPTGLIYDFKRVAQFPMPRAGTSLIITSNFGQRSLVGIGGLSGSTFDARATRFDLSASGLIGATGDVATTLSARMLSPVFESAGTVRTLLGLSAVTGHIDTLTGTTVASSEIAGLRNDADAELGFGFLRAGRRGFLLGGLDGIQALSFTAARPRRQSFAVPLNDLAPAAVVTGALTRRRAYPGSVFAPPFVYVAGGIVCTADNTIAVANPATNATDCDMPGERALSKSIEVLLVE